MKAFKAIQANAVFVALFFRAASIDVYKSVFTLLTISFLLTSFARIRLVFFFKVFKKFYFKFRDKILVFNKFKDKNKGLLSRKNKVVIFNKFRNKILDFEFTCLT